jgi:methionyl-tRNA formyltransferase
MKYILFANPVSGSPILTELIKTNPPEVVITTFNNIDSWKRIIFRFITNKFTVEDKLRYFYKIKFYDYRSLNNKRLKKIIDQNQIELAFIATFSYIIPQEFIDLFPKGIYNFHPSLLPKHGGPNPLFWVIFSKDEFTGTTCHKVTNVLDHGEVLLQTKYPVNKLDSKDLFNLFMKDVKEMIPRIIDNFSQLVSNLTSIETTEYDPKEVPNVNLNDKNLNSDIVKLYKRAIKSFP